MLQYQSAMFTASLARMLAETASGNPAVIAAPIAWSTRLIGEHPVAANTSFATFQLLLALGIAWRPTVKVALAGSVAWALAVWWLGEGLGGVLTGEASPANGAPGAVILYALLAVLLWPASHDRPSRCPADRAVGAPTARALWVLLWGSLAYFAVRAAIQPSPSLADLMAGPAGQPGWIAAMDGQVGGLLAAHVREASGTLAALLAVVAAGVFLPARAGRATVALAVLVAAGIWVVGQNFGGFFAGGSTDLDSGPLLALLAVAYWPARANAPRAAQARTELARTELARTELARTELARTELARGPAGPVPAARGR